MPTLTLTSVSSLRVTNFTQHPPQASHSGVLAPSTTDSQALRLIVPLMDALTLALLENTTMDPSLVLNKNAKIVLQGATQTNRDFLCARHAEPVRTL